MSNVKKTADAKAGSGKQPDRARSVAFLCDFPVSYDTGIEIQDKLVTARIDNQIPDTILFLEHKPVFTMGIRAKEEHVLCPPETLEKRNIALSKSSRGGDVTYHGPGQLVIYPVLKLEGPEADVHSYVDRLEEVAIKTAKHFGVNTFRREGMTGAWTDSGKIAAIGVRLKRWTTFHGMSFNVAPDLSHYAMIIPCGLKKEKVTSLAEILGRHVALVEARKVAAQVFSEIFHRELTISKVQSLSDFTSILQHIRC